MKNKYFSIRAISIATYLGGPLAGGILMSLNFQRFEQKDKAFWTLISSFLATVVLFWMMLQVPEEIIEKIPNFLLPLLYTPVVASLADKWQKAKIQELEAEEAAKEPWWKSAGIGVLGTILTFAVAFQLAAAEPPFKGEKHLYGKLQHEIYYQGNTISKDLLNRFGAELEGIGYFSDEFVEAAHIEEWETRYIFSIYVDEAHWDNPAILDELSELKKRLELTVPKEVSLVMLHPTFTELKEKRI